MEGLSDIKQVLLRAKFHTDQIEGILHYATFESANPKHAGIPASGRVASSVEICSCPPGYTGSSCEECAYSYRKSSKDSWLNECVKCDCNGHSLTCDFDGKCEVIILTERACNFCSTSASLLLSWAFFYTGMRA